ncbi:hypothetical protein JCM13304A_23160 [Desulfothermus okinawensis JCM 13304]
MGGELLYKFLGLAIPGGILTFVFGIFCGGILISFFSMLLGIIKKVKFYEKLSLQMLRMGFFAFWVYIILDVAYGCFMVHLFSLKMEWGQLKELFFKSSILQLDLALLFGSVVLFLIVFLLKDVLKKNRNFFTVILACVNIILWLGIYGAINLKFYYFHENISFLDIQMKEILFPKELFPVLMFWAYLFLSIGTASLYSTFYLMLRRNRDDFGRDYYKFTIPACARWWYAIIIYLIFSISKALMVFGSFSKVPLIVWGILGVELLVVLIVFTLNHKLIKSEHPIRLKEIMVLSPFWGVLMNILFVMGSIFELGYNIVSGKFF